MQLSAPLTIKRETLIAKIEAVIEQRRANYEAQQQKLNEARAQRVELFMVLLATEPDTILQRLELSYWDEDTDEVVNDVSILLNRSLSGEITQEQAIETVKSWNKNAYELRPDPTATKLLSVLQAAEDETLYVTAEDDLYPYL